MLLAARNGLIGAALCMAMASPGIAMDKSSIFWLQTTLNDHGFDAGKPDGRMGNKTRAAITAFSKKYGPQPDPDKIIGFMVAQNARHAEPITDPEALEQIRVGVGRDLRDPGSAQVRDVRRVKGHDGQRFICGEVNGKNAYGAYAGFTAFSTAYDIIRIGNVSTGYDTMNYFVDTDTKFSFWRCLLAFPKM
jgi:peptidoglycan hydrolase-like protein with peptidoglycan-binding domain